MKNTLFLFLAFFTLLSCGGNSFEVSPGERTTADAERLFDAGEVHLGEVIKAEFKITNTGKTPLVIGRVTPQCSCTVPSYPEDPILPGESGVIKAMVNTDGMSTGALRKTVTLTTSADPSNIEMVIKAKLVRK